MAISLSVIQMTTALRSAETDWAETLPPVASNKVSRNQRQTACVSGSPSMSCDCETKLDDTSTVAAARTCSAGPTEWDTARCLHRLLRQFRCPRARRVSWRDVMSAAGHVINGRIISVCDPWLADCASFPLGTVSLSTEFGRFVAFLQTTSSKKPMRLLAGQPQLQQQIF